MSESDTLNLFEPGDEAEEKPERQPTSRTEPAPPDPTPQAEPAAPPEPAAAAPGTPPEPAAAAPVPAETAATEQAPPAEVGAMINGHDVRVTGPRMWEIHVDGKLEKIYHAHSSREWAIAAALRHGHDATGKYGGTVLRAFYGTPEFGQELLAAIQRRGVNVLLTRTLDLGLTPLEGE